MEKQNDDSLELKTSTLFNLEQNFLNISSPEKAEELIDMYIDYRQTGKNYFSKDQISEINVKIFELNNYISKKLSINDIRELWHYG